VVFRVLSTRQLPRISLPRTPVNKDKRKGWAQERPTSNSGTEKELLRVGRPTPPIPQRATMNLRRTFQVRKTRKMSKKDAYDLKKCCESIAYR
jgi:hypothetical protein